MNVLTNQIYEILEQVKDPEIPVLSVVEMGIITQVIAESEQQITVRMTPTFVGCPAIGFMKKGIEKAIKDAGFENVEVIVDFKTHWTSDRMTDAAKEKLEKFGIAPPPKINGKIDEVALNKVRCPHCGSTNTTLNSPFGSTLCRAIRFCFDCKQGFEQFKPV